MADEEDPKRALVRELDRARDALSVHAQAARAEANPGAKLRNSVSKHRVAWIGATALLGLALARLSTRTKAPPARKPEPHLPAGGKTGIVMGTLKFGIHLAKPFMMAWATRRLTDLAQRSPHFSPNSPKR